jgi:hypothetical protein
MHKYIYINMYTYTHIFIYLVHYIYHTCLRFSYEYWGYNGIQGIDILCRYADTSRYSYICIYAFMCIYTYSPSFYQYFLEKTGHKGLNNIISAYEDKTAYAQCIFSYCGGRGQEVQTFVGRTKGKIMYYVNSLICF